MPGRDLLREEVKHSVKGTIKINRVNLRGKTDGMPGVRVFCGNNRDLLGEAAGEGVREASFLPLPRCVSWFPWA